MSSVAGRAFSEANKRAAEWSSILDRMIAASGVPETVVSRTLGRTRKAVRRYRDSESTASIGLADLAALPAPILRPLLERLAAGIGLGVAELPESGADPSGVKALGTLAHESGEAIAVLAEALADGAIDAGEAARIDKEAADLVRAALGVQTMARRAMRERVIGVGA